MPAKLKVFLSYSHKDKDMKTELDKSLIMLKRSDKIAVWQDEECKAGEDWDSLIKSELAAADIVLLLISVDFNNSQYIWEKELAVSMDRHAKGEARVIPIILRDCDWHDAPYAKLQALPDGAMPIANFQNKDEAYTNVAKRIRSVVDYMLTK